MSDIKQDPCGSEYMKFMRAVAKRKHDKNFRLERYSLQSGFVEYYIFTISSLSILYTAISIHVVGSKYKAIRQDLKIL